MTSLLFTDKAIKTLDTDNLYIEIASEPYGFDIKKTDTSQFKYILASALPGKYAPISVGQNIAKTVRGRRGVQAFAVRL